MSIPESWRATAYNPVPESENRIHSDEMAKAYGFRGGLVPGVVVSAYLLHPAAEAWGHDWLERGFAEAVVHSPVYDGEEFSVEVEHATEDRYEATLVDERGTRCATARVALTESPAEAPKRRGDALLLRDAERPTATPEVMRKLRESGLGAMPARWSKDSEITSYLRDPAEMATVYRDLAAANPAFILGLTNWVFAQNVRMNPWIHLQTDSQHYRAIAPGTELVAEAAITDLFDKKGHEFADVEVNVFDQRDDAAVASIRLRAIYRVRAP